MPSGRTGEDEPQVQMARSSVARSWCFLQGRSTSWLHENTSRRRCNNPGRVIVLPSYLADWLLREHHHRFQQLCAAKELQQPSSNMESSSHGNLPTSWGWMLEVPSGELASEPARIRLGRTWWISEWASSNHNFFFKSLTDRWYVIKDDTQTSTSNLNTALWTLVIMLNST